MFLKSNFVIQSSKYSDCERLSLYIIFEPYKQCESLGPVNMGLKLLKRITGELYTNFEISDMGIAKEEV